MDEERRYSDEEVEEIFREAFSPEAQKRGLPSRRGLTLAELQTIGSEVGVAPQRIAEAAARLEQQPGVLPRKTVLGVPVSVGRVVDLPRAPSDREWGILVGELREIFDAQGRESSGPGVWSWNNGNLHVVVEPTEAGYRLRTGTRKGNAGSIFGMGIFFLLFALFFLVGDEASAVTALMFGVMGVGAISYNAIRLPLWARERGEQMDYIADRVVGMLSRPAEV
jgi:hypothetical protein